MNMKKNVNIDELRKKILEDPEYQEKIRRSEERQLENRKRNHELMKPVLSELKKIGYSVYSITELKDINSLPDEAYNILESGFENINDKNIRRIIIYALQRKNVPYETVSFLITQFKTNDDTNIPLWELGDTIGIIHKKEHVTQILEIVQVKKYGKPREMLVHGLGKYKDPETVNTLLQLLDDEQVCGHAIIALKKQKSIIALDKIKPFINHEKTWIRNEAKKAVNILEKEKLKQDKKIYKLL